MVVSGCSDQLLNKCILNKWLFILSSYCTKLKSFIIYSEIVFYIFKQTDFKPNELESESEICIDIDTQL